MQQLLWSDILQLRVVVDKVLLELGADAGVVGIVQAGEQSVVERDLSQVARVVHKALSLELLEGVGEHAGAHGLAVAQERWRVWAGGAVGGKAARAAQHVSRGGSLRDCLFDLGYELDEINDLLLLSYPLPGDWRFTNAESSGREAVECYVQVGIRDLQEEFREFLHIVSRVRPTDFFDSDEAQVLAREIVSDFKEVYDCAVA